MSFEEAYNLAFNLRSDVDYCLEYGDAFVFTHKDDCTIGGNGPVVVLKASGDCINMVAYIEESDGSGMVKEGYIDGWE